MFYYYYDWTYILVLIGVVLSLLASAKVKSTFARYSNVRRHYQIRFIIRLPLQQSVSQHMNVVMQCSIR